MAVYKCIFPWLWGKGWHCTHSQKCSGSEAFLKAPSGYLPGAGTLAAGPAPLEAVCVLQLPYLSSLLSQPRAHAPLLPLLSGDMPNA